MLVPVAQSVCPPAIESPKEASLVVGTVAGFTIVPVVIILLFGSLVIDERRRAWEEVENQSFLPPHLTLFLSLCKQ